MVAYIAILVILLSVSLSVNLLLSALIYFHYKASKITKIDDSGIFGGQDFDLDDDDDCDDDDPEDWWKRGEEFRYTKEG